MRPRLRYAIAVSRQLLSLALICTLSRPVFADPLGDNIPATALPEPVRTSVYLSTGHADNNYQEGAGVRLVMDTQLQTHQIRAELVRQNRFNLTGEFASLQVTSPLNDQQFVSAAIGAGTSRLFALWNTAVVLNQRWGLSNEQVTGIGLAYASLRDSRSETSLLAQHAWYVNDQVVVQAGVRAGRASPGSVASNRRFVALTLGNVNQSHLVINAAKSHEAYQLVQDTTLMQFVSEEAGATFFQPISTDQRVSITADRYKNPFYTRNRLELGWGLTW